MPRFQTVIFVSLLALFFTACAHKREQASVPPPPPIAEPSANLPTTAQPETKPKSGDENEEDEEKEALKIPLNAKPLAIETGLASWYGAPYHNRRGSNGEVYNMHAMTAAHLTLPLGSIVRVTNVKTGASAIVRVTDRGPFVEGRIIDLSLAAAKKIDVWKPGVATVRLEVLEAPVPLDSGGRWAVQIGPFEKEGPAHKLEEHLSRRYHTAKVLSFDSPTGDWWVRVRVQEDDRKRATEVAQTTQTDQGAIFLVRLD
ncbi:MAG TPA: septal ring lytic transglycosylase RlpA family protein [Terriglobales bacterium]|nr:septal ring lytic transglycosylase RlpA family protein [Terriglobales bacterium]